MKKQYSYEKQIAKSWGCKDLMTFDEWHLMNGYYGFENNMNCAVIIDEERSLPYCIIKSKKIVSDGVLKDYAKQWMKEHNDNCPWSLYRCVIKNVNDAPKLKNVCII